MARGPDPATRLKLSFLSWSFTILKDRTDLATRMGGVTQNLLHHFSARRRNRRAMFLRIFFYDSQSVLHMCPAKSFNRVLLRFQVFKIHRQAQTTIVFTGRSGDQRWQAGFFSRCLLVVASGLVFSGHGFRRPTSFRSQLWPRKHSASQMRLNDVSGNHRFCRVRGPSRQ